jgi:hypothetical protein
MQWTIAKSKDEMTGTLHRFRLEIVTVGLDDEHDEITSCVAVPDESVKAIEQVKLPQGGNQKLVLDALRPLFRADVTEGAPPVRPCIELESAVIAGAAKLTCPTDKRTSRAREAITGMVSRGVLGCNEGWLWLT